MSLWSRLRGLTGGLLTAFAAGACLFLSSLLLQPNGADAARDERTLTLYEIHLKETSTVTFKRDGKYLPAGLKKLNHAMRDWRTGATTTMDPKLFDLVWELKQQLGYKKAIHVISGHRSAKTNRRLRRRGGGQARKSQHVGGRAMDIHFPGLKVSMVRKHAFLLETGGVGYYPTSALPFVHVDTARVRAWPRMNRTQLAMLFPHGATKHRPSSGGPLNSKDRKRARTQLAALARESHIKTLLANASIPGNNVGTAKSASGRASGMTIASLAINGYGTMEIPGVSRPTLANYASRLWINKPGNKAFPPTSVASAKPVQIDKGQFRLASAEGTSPPAGNGSTHAMTRSATIQLASLAPEPPVAARPNQNLWVNGVTPRADWTTEEPVENNENTSPDATAQFMPEPRDIVTLASPTMQQARQTKFDAERVSYAPAFDEEHPDELSYRPFQIMPLMTTTPVAQNKMLVAMVEPKYDRVHELLASSENIPMQFRPSSREAHALWDKQFKGKAILNIRHHARNIEPATRPRKLAQH
ncbi:MAG: DUF882 domain-containing protein [bacterium]|nr:DUF882 domain-containing protein [bacterium]